MYSESSSVLVESLVLAVLHEPSSEQLRRDEMSLQESVLGKGSLPLKGSVDWKPTEW